MKDIIISFIIAGLGGTGALAAAAAGFLQKRKGMYWLAAAALLVGIGAGAYGAYQLAKRAYHTVAEVKESLAPRTGTDIYKAEFSGMAESCVQVLHHNDAYLPVVDDEIWLHFRLCPAEARRLLAQGYAEHAGGFGLKDDLLERLGKGTRKYEKTDSSSWRSLWLSADSTEAIYQNAAL